VSIFNEDTVEYAAPDWLREVGWATAFGPDIEPDGPHPERSSPGETIFTKRLRAALERLNVQLPASALEAALTKVLRVPGPDLSTRNRTMHRMLVDSVEAEYRDASGTIRGAMAALIDFENPANNHVLAKNRARVLPPRLRAAGKR
jgi:type I restriction enzyme R subunit